LRTQFTFSPSIDTRYLSPSCSATTIGNEMTRPLFLPRTSSAAARRGHTPAAYTAADARFCQRAHAFGRPRRYIQRT